MNEKVSSTLAKSASALLWTVHYFGSPWAAWSKKPKIFLSPKGLRQKTEIFSLLSLSPKGLRKISAWGQVSELGRTRPSVPRVYPTKVGLSRTHSEKPPYPGGMHKQGFPRGDGAKSRETYKSGLRLRTDTNLSSMRLSILILADFNALLRRSRVPSCLPRLLETHTEYGFLFVSLS